MLERSTLAATRVVSNSARITGGGLGAYSGSHAFDCIVAGNTASNAAGGCVVWQDASLTRCAIAQNHSIEMAAVWVLSNGCLSGCSVVSNHSAGGAVYFSSGAGGVATNCHIAWNSGRHSGGICLNQHGNVSDSIVEYNCSTHYGGGGALLMQGGALHTSIIRNNNATGQYGKGGGVECFGGGLIVHCTIIANHAEALDETGQGGGVYMYAGGMVSSSYICGNSVGGNTRGGLGGGVCMRDGGIVTHSLVCANQAMPSYDSADSARGGGVFVAGGGAIDNCLIVSNRAEHRSSFGGGVCSPDSSLVAANCTIVANYARDEGGGVDGGKVRNSIAYANTSLVAEHPNHRNASFQYSCTYPLPGGPGNVSNAPLFMADYHLAPGSPCIDAGTNAYVTWDIDLAGMPRIINGVVDMGCYEYVPEPLTCITGLLLCACRLRCVMYQGRP